jgi:F-type H+-transporting ATPase subunit delta
MAEALDKSSPVADVYAAALFDLASEAGRVAEVRQELEELVRLEGTEPGFAHFLRSDAIGTDKRQASLEKMFRDRLSDIVLDTLQVMSGHGRSGLLPALLRCYVLRQEHSAGQIEVRAMSAVELDAVQRAEIEHWAGRLSGRRPLVEYVVDPRLIGGLVVQIGDCRFDNSVRRHLRDAHTRLMERSTRGLSIGVEG